MQVDEYKTNSTSCLATVFNRGIIGRSHKRKNKTNKNRGGSAVVGKKINGGVEVVVVQTKHNGVFNFNINIYFFFNYFHNNK